MFLTSESDLFLTWKLTILPSEFLLLTILLEFGVELMLSVQKFFLQARVKLFVVGTFVGLLKKEMKSLKFNLNKSNCVFSFNLHYGNWKSISIIMLAVCLMNSVNTGLVEIIRKGNLRYADLIYWALKLQEKSIYTEPLRLVLSKFSKAKMSILKIFEKIFCI